MLIDLHVHTLLSSDSNVAPEQYVEAAARGPRRLDAICFTEHRLFPADAALDQTYGELSERFGVRVFKGVEADTDFGHLLIFGVNREIQRRFDLDARMHRAEQMLEVVHGEGGIAIGPSADGEGDGESFALRGIFCVESPLCVGCAPFAVDQYLSCDLNHIHW